MIRVWRTGFSQNPYFLRLALGLLDDLSSHYVPELHLNGAGGGFALQTPRTRLETNCVEASLFENLSRVSRLGWSTSDLEECPGSKLRRQRQQ